MRIEGRVGIVRYPDGTEGPPRLGNQGETFVGQLNPPYSEQTIRGNQFVYASAVGGAVLNVFGTTTAPFLWNPSGNGKVLVITRVVVGLAATGTTAAGHIVYGFQNNVGSQIGTAQPVISGTFVAGVNTAIGNPLAAASVMRFVPTTISLTTACTFLCTMGVGQATAGTTATNPFEAVDDVDGRIQIWPGSAFSVAASAAIASTYNVSIYGLELPIALFQ